MDIKSTLRKQIIERRESLSRQQVEEKSRAVMNCLVSLPEFIKASTVMSYMDFRNEVRTREIIAFCLSNGKRVAAPRVDKSGGKGASKLVAYEIRDLEKDFEPGTFGLLEPRTDESRIVAPEEVDLVLVPGVVFDRKGNRIGFGAGYYDRFLARTRNDCIKAAVAFDFQVLDEIPAEEHDIPMDIIITESGVIYNSKGERKN